MRDSIAPDKYKKLFKNNTSKLMPMDEVKKNLEILNRERVSRAAYGISSICQLLGVIHRHQSGEVLIENEEFMGIAGRYISGGLETAIMELSTTIQNLTEPEL